MFDQEFISKLGRKSVSRDTALTKERVNAAWKNATKEQQKEVLALANAQYASAYRVRTTGLISIKMAIAYAQALNLDPYYLTGAVPENRGYSYAAAKLLLKENKYGKAVFEYEQTYKPEEDALPPAEKDASPGAEASTDEPIPEAEADFSLQDAIQKLGEDEIITLFRGLIIKAGTGKQKAIADITKIIKILLN